MAREGLRTLVVGKKVLSEEQYALFEVSMITLHYRHYHILVMLVVLVSVISVIGNVGSVSV
jgi:hypothetical protein